MTSNDDFTRAARAEAEDRHPPTHRNVPMYCLADVREREAVAFEAGAEWARTYPAAQETDGERAVRELHRPVDVEPSDTICAACSTLRGSGESLRYFPTKEWPCATIQALDAARRDKEKR